MEQMKQINSDLWTVSREEINSQIRMRRPHVVILGAGASKAACLFGDKNGEKIPLMDDLTEIKGLDKIIKKLPARLKKIKNFEKFYSRLDKEGLMEIKGKVEKIVYDYFDSLELPDYPTIYDHLLLGLRSKDLIATFNWDPFLIQAYVRNNYRFTKNLPAIIFLHGNVKLGYCEKDKIKSLKENPCPQCKKNMKITRLLYPIENKNYTDDTLISEEWNILREYLRNAFKVTIFGYGAPKTDVEAVRLMKEAWGNISNRTLERIEIIDIKNKSELIKFWKPFIFETHYDINHCFYESSIALHPRRTGESFLNTNIEGKWVSLNPIPKYYGLNELWNWVEPIVEVENKKELIEFLNKNAI